MPWEPILPKGPIFDAGSIEGKAEARMRRLTNDLQRACANYEVKSETRRVRRKRGKGTRIIGYKQTGTLKKSWSHRVGYGILTRALVGEVRSSGKVAPYNIYVRDPKRQARHMAARGWRTTEAIMSDYWPKAEADFRRILLGGR